MECAILMNYFILLFVFISVVSLLPQGKAFCWHISEWVCSNVEMYFSCMLTALS